MARCAFFVAIFIATTCSAKALVSPGNTSAQTSNQTVSEAKQEQGVEASTRSLSAIDCGRFDVNICKYYGCEWKKENEVCREPVGHRLP